MPIAQARIRRAAIPFLLVAGVLAGTPRPAEATVITAFPVDFSTAEGADFNGAVATFEDDNPSAGPADFTATVDWGDGSPVTSATSLGFSSAAFVVMAEHTYADEGTFTVTVTISDVAPGTGTATVTDTATVTEADVLSGTPTSFSAPAGASFTTVVATFSDTFAAAVPSDFTATIDWGDATTSAGSVSGGGGTFQVTGTHTYAGTGTFPVIVTLTDDAPGTATATVTSTATVSAGLAVTALPFTVPEHAAFNGTVANFSDADTTSTPASFTSTINWGDGASTAGTVSGSGGVFSVSGQHTYSDEGSFTTSVAVTKIGGPTASDSATATVSEADTLAGTPVAFSPQAAVPFSGTVATFSDTDTANVASDFSATIDWGDGNTTAGTVSGGGGAFTVTGTHTYAAVGLRTVTVTLTDDPPGTATATVTSTANVGAAPVVAIPTLDARGLLLLGLAVAGLACVRLRAARAGARGRTPAA